MGDADFERREGLKDVSKINDLDVPEANNYAHPRHLIREDFQGSAVIRKKPGVHLYEQAQYWRR